MGRRLSHSTPRWAVLWAAAWGLACAGVSPVVDSESEIPLVTAEEAEARWAGNDQLVPPWSEMNLPIGDGELQSTTEWSTGVRYPAGTDIADIAAQYQRAVQLAGYDLTQTREEYQAELAEAKARIASDPNLAQLLAETSRLVLDVPSESFQAQRGETGIACVVAAYDQGVFVTLNVL